MTTRAILWHGALRPPLHDPKHRPRSHWDYAAGVRDFGFACEAARALGVARDEIYAFVCHDDLLPEDFVGRRARATVSELRDVVQQLARRSTPNDALLFVAANHGCSDGLVTMPPSDQPLDEFSDGPSEPFILTPGDLGACLSLLPGPQVVVVVTCYAGVFLPLGNHPNRLVLTGCAADEIYEVEDEEQPHSPFLIKLLSRWCGISLPDDIPPSRRLPLDAAFAAAARDLDAPHRTKPLRNGTVVWP